MEIANLRQRIAKAESDRDTWRAAGRQENYLEACSMVDALGVQLDQIERSERRIAAEAAPAAAKQAKRARAAPPLPVPAAA